MCALTALWGEAAVCIDPEEELRDQLESASYYEKKSILGLLLETK